MNLATLRPSDPRQEEGVVATADGSSIRSKEDGLAWFKGLEARFRERASREHDGDAARGCLLVAEACAKAAAAFAKISDEKLAGTKPDLRQLLDDVYEQLPGADERPVMV